MSGVLRVTKTYAAVAITVAAAMLLAACGSGAGTRADTVAARTGGDATFAVDSPFLGFDPNVTSAAQDARVLRQVFDSLLYLDDDRTLQPWLASSWTESPDGLTYTFSLRNDVTFQDGSRFDSAAVCFNLDRIKNPATGSIYAIGLIGPYASCDAPDPSTAVVHLSAPYSPLLNNLTSPFMGINSPTAVATKSADEYKVSPVGTGPFLFLSYTPNDRVRLGRYDNYNWAPANAEHEGAARLDSLTFQIIPDATVRMGSVQSGAVDAASGIPEQQAETIDANPAISVVTQELSGSPFQLNLNSSRAPFDDSAVRRAASMAVDTASTLRALYAGVVQRAWGPLSPQTIGYNPAVEDSVDFDPEQARQLLDGAGWIPGPDGIRIKNGVPLHVRYLEGTPNREKRQDIATFFAANLRDVGFDVETVFLTTALLQAASQNNDYDMIGLSLIAPDPNVLYQIYNGAFVPQPGRNGFNFSHTDDPTVNAALSDAQTAADRVERDQKYAAVQQNVLSEARSIPVYIPAYTVALGPMYGIRFDAEGYPIFFDAYLSR